MMHSPKISNTVVVGAAAVGVGVAVGAGIAYLSTRVMYSTRVTQQIAQLHDNIVEMRQNLAVIEQELGKLHSAPSVGGILQQKPNNSSAASTTSSRKSRLRKNVSFNNAVSETSYPSSSTVLLSSSSALSSAGSFVTADEGSNSILLSDGGSTAGYDTDYFSPDEGEDSEEFYDFASSSDTEDNGGITSSSNSSQYLTAADSWSSNSSAAPASALTELLKRVDAQFNSGVEEDILAAHRLLLDAETNYENNAELLWRLAKSHRNLATLEEKKGNLELKKNYIFDAYGFAERALAVNAGSPDTHKWFAIISGARGEYLGTKERIASGRVFKQHIDEALTFSPNDATLHHLLGRFCYEISGLTWLERKAAAALFGAVPDSSYAEALQHFKAAEALHVSGWKENRLFIAKCLIKMGELQDVPSWLQKALDLPANTADDMVVDKELQLLIERHPAQ